MGTTEADEAGRWATWRHFPADERPRPVVLLDSWVRICDAGFVDGAAKQAWASGAIRAAVPLPDALLGLLAAGGAGDPREGLVLTACEPCESAFLCDRGPRRLPAHRLSITGLKEPCVVLDPDGDRWWPADEPPAGLDRPDPARIEADDSTVHFPESGGFLTEFRRAEFVEHEAYVVGVAITSERPVPAGTVVPLIGVGRYVSGRLTAPLGWRVLTDERGRPLAALPVEA